MNKISITKAFRFEAAHYLPKHKGKCREMHGHSYVLEVTITGPISDDGEMVLDFVDVKRIMFPMVDALDHSILNDLIENPTTENILIWLRDRISSDLHDEFPHRPVVLTKLRLWETKDSYATWELIKEG